MELFAAATGSSDEKIARIYLERAGNDVTVAVNHFLDAPPPATGATTVVTASRHERGSSPRALKRPRPREHSVDMNTINKSSQQALLPFNQTRGLCSRGAGRLFAAERPTTICAKPGQADQVASDTLSAEWKGIGLRCPRSSLAPESFDAPARPPSAQPFSEGVPFEDESFPPRPTSLDGRPGTKKLSGHAEDRRSRTSCDDQERVRCECAASAKVVTVAKAGVNQGRLFYGCVTRKCNFFRWADDAPHTRQALSLVWRRFSPPRFKLCAGSGSGDDGGSGFKPQDIKQGAVGDCWFLAGLAVISERRDLIARVLGGNGPVSDQVGCYEVNLFKDGRWERVRVDSWLPCKNPAGLKGKEKGLDYVPAFAKASANNQIWPCIVEKAFAKQHGSYNAISGGHVCEAFEALTGAPTETIILDHDDSETNWAKLLSFSHAEFPMGCATAWDPMRDLRDVGLVSTHAYSILEVRELPPGVRGARQPSIRDWVGLGSATAAAAKARMTAGEHAAQMRQPLRLVRVRNPWGRKEWTGEWSDRSERWSDSVRAELGWSRRNDGTFWMTWQDFMTRFELIDVCKARKGWAHASVATQIVPPPEASSSFRLRHHPSPTEAAAESEKVGSSRTWAYITVVQPTKRGRKDRYWYRALGLLVTEGGSAGRSQGDYNSNNNHQKGGSTTLVAARLGGAKRRISCEVFLEKGRAYTASVVCLSGRDGNVRSTGSVSGSSLSASSLGFVLTVYSTRRLQVVAGEQRPGAAGYFPVGPPLHQAVSHLWLTAQELLIGNATAQELELELQSFALCGGAALALISNDSAVFFILINDSSGAEVGLRLTLTAVEGATISSASPISESSSSSSVSWCPPGSQKVVLVLARKAEYGTFRHEFFYQLVRPPPVTSSSTPRVASQIVEAGRAVPTPKGLGEQSTTSRQAEAVDPCSSQDQEGEESEIVPSDRGVAETKKASSARTATFSYSGVFWPHPLVPGARDIVRRAHDAQILLAGGSGGDGGAVEGMGGGTIGGGVRDLGSAL